jgi:hypothetical protein
MESIVRGYCTGRLVMESATGERPEKRSKANDERRKKLGRLVLEAWST